MRERDVERYLCRKVEELGGWAIKLTSPAQTGLPDRLVVWRDGTVWFVEVKAPGKALRPQQRAVMRRLETILNQVCAVVDSIEAVDWLLKLEDTRG
jgi:hypothetical protein